MFFHSIFIWRLVLQQKRLVLSIFGPIGVGKEGITIALENIFGLIPVSMSGAIKHKKKHDPEYAQRFPRVIGKNYPFEAVDLAFNAFIDQYADSIGFVIDGVPRGTPEQVEMVINRFSPVHYDIIFIHLVCSRDKCEERVRGRREARINDGLEERDDDKPEVVADRLEEHFNEVDMLVDAVKAYSGSLIEINAEKSQAEVLREVVERVRSAITIPAVV